MVKQIVLEACRQTQTFRMLPWWADLSPHIRRAKIYEAAPLAVFVGNLPIDVDIVRVTKMFKHRRSIIRCEHVHVVDDVFNGTRKRTCCKVTLRWGVEYGNMKHICCSQFGRFRILEFFFRRVPG
ncbi:hypothetical protein N9L68_00880 [bacterium]|nr:hypothetical protein [bacterium]